jgi:putative transposase
MPRQARLVVPEMIYHVTARGNNRDRVFHSNEDFARYFDLCKRYKEKYDLKLYHWVFMHNHVHLLLQGSTSQSLSKAMQGIGLAYTIWYNRKYDRVGHLWQDRFKSFPVEATTYLLECGRYIERNPVRAGMVDWPADYRWSSFQVHGSGKDDGLTDHHPFFDEFGKDLQTRQRVYQEYVMSPRAKEEQELREHFASGVVGGDCFTESLIVFDRNRRRPKRGRPRKTSCKAS